MKKRLFFLALSLSILTTMTTCKKDIQCYDEQLYQQHKNDFCTLDCPGVVGCDGKKYCNECVANAKGIRLK